MSTNPENLVKIGPVHPEVLVSKGTVKIKKGKTVAEHTARSAGRQAGRAG